MMIPLAHWSNDTENVLKKIRLNSLLRSKYHKMSYFNTNKLLKYFRIPVIVLSGLSSVFNIALQNYMPINIASLICCFISLIVGIIGSIEMFLQIQKRMEIDLHNSKSFAFLANDITKLLNLSREHRTVDGLIYLEEKMNEYNSLVDLSVVTDVKLDEKMLELDLIDNLTPEEQLTILSNDTSDNLQSIFRKYKLRFLRQNIKENSPWGDLNLSHSYEYFRDDPSHISSYDESLTNQWKGYRKQNRSLSSTNLDDTEFRSDAGGRSLDASLLLAEKRSSGDKSRPETDTVVTGQNPETYPYDVLNASRTPVTNYPYKSYTRYVAPRRSGSRAGRFINSSQNSYYTNKLASQLVKRMTQGSIDTDDRRDGEGPTLDMQQNMQQQNMQQQNMQQNIEIYPYSLTPELRSSAKNRNASGLRSPKSLLIDPSSDILERGRGSRLQPIANMPPRPPSPSLNHKIWEEKSSDSILKEASQNLEASIDDVVAQDAAQDATKDANKDAAKDTAQDATQDVTQNSAQNSSISSNSTISYS